jgi:hypothetical protein
MDNYNNDQETKIIALIAIKTPVPINGSVDNARMIEDDYETAKKYLLSQISKNYQSLISDINDEFIVECDVDHFHWIQETVTWLADKHKAFTVYAGLGDTILQAREAAEVAEEKKTNGEIEIYHFIDHVKKSEMMDAARNVLTHIQQNKKYIESLKNSHPRIYDSVCQLTDAAAKKIKSEKGKKDIKEEVERLQTMDGLNQKIGKHLENLKKEDGDKLGKLADILIDRQKKNWIDCLKTAKEHGVDHRDLLKVSRLSDG